MGKWWAGLLIVILSALPILFHRSSSPLLLEDTDTKVLLQAIRQRQDPLSWFGGDWPLGNHFYRPVSTLFFEFDNAVWGSNAAGYGWTNAVVAFLCVLALYWFLREFFDRVELAVAGSALFAIWHLGWSAPLVWIAHWLAIAALLLALLPGRRIGPAVLAFLCLVFVEWELAGNASLQFRMIEWLPGRTASVMALFVLIALAAYSRYERLSAQSVPKADPGPLDPPATKGTKVARPSRFTIAWAILAAAGLALALGSYEQAVIAPGLLFGVALAHRMRGRRVRWGWQGAFWGLLLGYLFLRSQWVPSDVSGYQAQQFRSGSGVVDSLLAYLVPAWGPLWALVRTLDVGLLIWLTWPPYAALVNVASNIAAAFAARKEWVLFAATWLASFVAFLPMAWLKHFDHYHYLPMAMRAGFVAVLLSVTARVLVSAASRPALQAPPRPHPAPGSLPRR